jgi:hypothetical protein
LTKLRRRRLAAIGQNGDLEASPIRAGKALKLAYDNIAVDHDHVSGA